MADSIDMDGVQIQIGDLVEWYDEEGDVEYTFTVDEIMDNNDIWGIEIPQAYCEWPHHDLKNWHTSTFSRVIKRGPKKPWEGSTLKFNFI